MNSATVERGSSLCRSSSIGLLQDGDLDSIWHLVFAQMPDVCLWIEPQSGRIIGCNAAICSLLSYDVQEVCGLLVHALAQPDDLNASASAWRAMAGGGELSDADVTVVAKDGQPVLISARSSCIRNTDGTVLCGMVVWRDITHRRKSELTLQESRRRLQTLAYELTVAEARERERIARGLHDEIGQTLAMAKFKLAALEQAGTHDGGTLLRDELHGLLTQAARAARSATFELSCPLLQQLGLQAAIDSLGVQTERAGGPAVQVDGTLPDLFLPEPVLAVVYRVVRELVLNAHKHARAQQIRIQLQCGHDHLVVCVCDDGVGFQPAQVSASFSPDGGFGLVSAEAQMQGMGGRLDVDSAPGLGTRVTVILPLVGI